MRPVLLYDDGCGFCRRALRWILAWDRRGAIRPVPLADPEAAVLLAGMSQEARMSSWHLVERGRVHSAGAAVGPLMRLLPGGAPLAALADAFPRATERLYRWVAANRARIERVFRKGHA